MPEFQRYDWPGFAFALLQPREDSAGLAEIERTASLVPIAPCGGAKVREFSDECNPDRSIRHDLRRK